MGLDEPILNTNRYARPQRKENGQVARVGESLRIGMLSSPSTSGKTYEDPCPIQTRRDKRIESESHAWARIGKNIGSSLFLTLLS